MGIPTIIFYIIILILILNFAFELWLDSLNNRHQKEELPTRLKGLYDEEKYKNSQLYHKEVRKFGMITSSFFLILTLLMLLLNGFSWLDNSVSQFTENLIWKGILFFGVLGLGADILSLPFQIYSTFVIEEKYGFNKSTVKLFILDKIKQWLLGGIIGGGLLALIIYIFNISGEWFWLIAWLAMSLFSLIFTYLYSSIIVPLFNKQTPLPEGDLKLGIEEFAQKADFKLENVYVIDGSKRSTKSNAYFTGFGKRKRIVLYDNLINNHSVEEIVAVLAHEIGHYKKKHIVTGMVLGMLQSLILFYVLSIFIRPESNSSNYFAEALQCDPSFHIGILVFGLLYSPISSVISILMNRLSRKHEYQADRFAAEYGRGKDLQDALIKLSQDNLSNLDPHPLYVKINYSHPPLLQRLQALDRK